MADAVVLSPEQIAALLAQQAGGGGGGGGSGKGKASEVSSAPLSLLQNGSAKPAAAGVSAPKQPPRLKTNFRLTSSFEPFFAGGSGTGNCTAVLPIAIPPSSSEAGSAGSSREAQGASGSERALLLTTLEDLIVVTDSHTGQVIARINQHGTPSSSSSSAAAEPAVEGDGDELAAITLSNVRWSAVSEVEPPAAAPPTDGEPSSSAATQEAQSAPLTVQQTSTTLVSATRALFLRFYVVTVTVAVSPSSSEPVIRVEARLQRSITRAHEAAIVVLSPSASLAHALRLRRAASASPGPHEQALQMLATGSSDGTVKVWDMAGGYCTHVLKGHGGVVSALAWDAYLPAAAAASDSDAASSKGKGKQPAIADRGARRINLFTGSVDGRVRFWDLLSGASASTAKNSGGGGVQQKPVQTLGAHVSVVRGLAVSADGRRLVTGSRDRTLGIWSLGGAGGAESKKKKKKHQNAENAAAAPAEWALAETVTADEGIECLGFLPEWVSSRLAGGDEDVGVRLGDDADDSRAASSAHQRLFYSAGSAGKLRLWDFEHARIVAVEPEDEAAPARKKQAAGADDDDEEETRAVQEVHLTWPLAPRGSALQFVVVHADQTFAWRSCPAVLGGSKASGADQQPLALTKQMIGYNDHVTDVVLLSVAPASDAGKDAASRPDSHVAIATNSHAVHVYTMPPAASAAEGSPQEAHSVSLLRGHTDNVLCLDRSCDARLIASGSKDRTCRVWAPRVEGTSSVSWRCVGVAQGHAESVGAVAFARRPAETKSDAALSASPFVVTASSDRTVKVWDLSALTADALDTPEPARLRSLTTLKIHDKDINSVDVAPNNALLISGSQDRTAKVFTLNYSAPSKANGGAASASLKLLSTCKGHKRGVWCVRFSPVDKAFATASGDKTIKLWSLQDFSCVRTFEGHTNSVLRVDFLVAGMQLLSTASDGLVKLWNVKDEICAWTGDAHDEQVWSVAVTKDNRRVVTVGADSMVRIWEDRTVEEEAEKQQKKTEEIQQEQQFSNYLVAKDYRNAIHLALNMNHPRRLLQLFSTVASQRPGGDAAAAAGALLESALRGSGAHAASADAVLRSAGVLPSTNGHANGAGAHSKDEDADRLRDRQSITGLYAVDRIIATLPSLQLVQLLHHVRDWNTSTRTSDIAQTILHAVLRLHSMENILDAFESVQGKGLGGTTHTGKGGLALSKDKYSKLVDASTLFESLLPYTERHYSRADRLLTEAAMLDFTLSSMNALVGDEPEDEAQDVEMHDAEEERSSSDEESDEASEMDSA